MYTRGQFALIGKVSLKAMRIYDEMGLLKPAFIDEKNQYKYYSSEQIDDILFINELKCFGFSLEEIKDIKERGKDEFLREKLTKRLDQIDAEIKESFRRKEGIERKLNYLNAGIDYPHSISDYTVEIIKRDEQVVASCRDILKYEDVGRLIGSVYERIHSFSLEAVDSHMLIFHDHDTASLNDEYDIEVCVPVNKVLQHEDFSTGILEERMYARTLHRGAFSTSGRAHAAIIDWVKENGYEICGSPVEKYITDSQAIFNPGSFKVEVLYPLNVPSL